MEPRRVEGSFSQGWGIAITVLIVAAGFFIGAGMIKRATFHSPNDVLAPSSTESSAAH